MGRPCKRECVECGLVIPFKKLSGGEPTRGACQREEGPDPTRLDDLNDATSNIVSFERRLRPVEMVKPAEIKPRFLSPAWFSAVIEDLTM